jgi:hypothetical protein
MYVLGEANKKELTGSQAASPLNVLGNLFLSQAVYQLQDRRLADRCRSSISLSPPLEARAGPELYQPATKYGRQERAKTTTQQTTFPASVTAYLSQPSLRA